MKDITLTPQEARAELVAANRQASRVQGSDRQFGPILLALAAMYAGAGILVGLFPRGGSRIADVVLVVILLGGLAGALTLIWRVRAYSRIGILRFVWACALFSAWNAAVIGLSTASGWWGYHQPGFHFTVTALVACLPLLFGGWLVGRKQP